MEHYLKSALVPDLVRRYSCGAIAEWQRVASAENIAGQRSSEEQCRNSSGGGVGGGVGGGDGTVGPMGLGRRVVGRGLHSSTIQLNLSGSYGIGGAFRGGLGGVWGCVLRGYQGVLRVYFVCKRPELS